MSRPQNPLLLQYDCDGYPHEYGTEITLRDLFAAFALMGLNASSPDGSSRDHSRWAYSDADAMLVERMEEPEGGAHADHP